MGHGGHAGMSMTAAGREEAGLRVDRGGDQHQRHSARQGTTGRNHAFLQVARPQRDLGQIRQTPPVVAKLHGGETILDIACVGGTLRSSRPVPGPKLLRAATFTAPGRHRLYAPISANA